MKISLIISVSIAVTLSIFFLTMFFKRFKVGVYYIDKHEEALKEMLNLMEINDPRYIPPVDYDNAIDMRGSPTHTCLCGSDIWIVKVVFKDYEIATYFLDMECLACGSLATAPTPIDKSNIDEI